MLIANLQSSLQMVVESEYPIAIATLSDSKSRASFSTNEKQNQSHLVDAIFPRFEQVTDSC